MEEINIDKAGIHGAFAGKKLRQNMIEINKAAQTFNKSLLPFLLIAKKAFDAMGNTFYKIMEKHYLEVNGKLPGSNKTKRLRKKRRKAVITLYRSRLIN